MKNEITYIGSIVRVIGSNLFVELSEDLPSSTPIIGGQIYKIGQIGSFVKVPLGSLNIFGIVTMVGASPIVQQSEDLDYPYGKRWLELQLIGESIGQQEFQRGQLAPQVRSTREFQ